jgi:ABC-type nitrate/sulfonate/bicarbonate transport system permease component
VSEVAGRETVDPTFGGGSVEGVPIDGDALRAADTMAVSAIGRAPGGTGGRPPGGLLAGGWRIARPLVNAVVTLVVIVGLWWAFVAGFGLDPLIAKTPADVWSYLVHGAAAEAGSTSVWGGLGRTLLDAAYGFVAGLAAAVAVALSFVLSRIVAGMLLPLAVLVRSVPLVAMTPVLTLVFGRGIAATTVIAGIVVFFPALVTMTFGLRSASRQSADLVRAYGGGTWTVARKVMLPSSLPALFASARIAVPGAVVGAMLAEWLATGQGLGYGMLQDANSFDYVDIWASAALLTGVSVILYNLIAIAESVVLARFSLRDAQ